MLYLIVTKLISGKPEAKQVCNTVIDALNLVQLYPEQQAHVVEIKPKTTIKLSRVSSEILKILDASNVKVRIV